MNDEKSTEQNAGGASDSTDLLGRYQYHSTQDPGRIVVTRGKLLLTEGERDELLLFLNSQGDSRFGPGREYGTHGTRTEGMVRDAGGEWEYPA